MDDLHDLVLTMFAFAIAAVMPVLGGLVSKADSGHIEA
jgi:hypothetical protein